jgi:hypothetical protein
MKSKNECQTQKYKPKLHIECGISVTFARIYHDNVFG